MMMVLLKLVSILLLASCPGIFGDALAEKDVEGWENLVKIINKARETLKENPDQIEKLETGSLKILKDQISQKISTQDPIVERRKRLNTYVSFLQKRESIAALGYHMDDLMKQIYTEEKTFILRCVNQTGDTMLVEVEGVEQPLQVPLNRVKRFMLSANADKPAKQFTFKGAVWAARYQWEIELVPGGGAEMILISPDKTTIQTGLGVKDSVSARLKPTLAKEKIDQLVKQLGADRFADRRAATQSLIKAGPSIKPQLEAALSESDDPEVNQRLKRIISTDR